MLDEYSIEQRATQMFDARTKEYFFEVLSCYAAGNHRSAVVMTKFAAVSYPLSTGLDEATSEARL